jgi:hypothetical protein
MIRRVSISAFLVQAAERQATATALEPTGDQLVAVAAGELGMELAGQDVAPLQRRDEAATMLGQRHLTARRRLHPIAVGEIGVARPQETAARLGLDPVPAKLGHADRIGEPADPPLDHGKPFFSGTLVAFLKQHLKTDAHGQHGPAGLGSGCDRLVEVGITEALHGSAKGADAGEDHPLRRLQHGGIGGEARAGAESGKCCHH